MDNNLIVCDVRNYCIRKVVTAEGRVTTVAGRVGQKGFADGLGAAARFNSPLAVAVDGNNNILVADRTNHRIRMIVGASARVTTVSGNTEAGAVDGASARFKEPTSLSLDEGGRLLMLEFNATRLRVVETSLVPPLLLAPKVLPAVQDPLRDDLSKLLDDTALTDVTFAVDGQRFPAHRCVLAARSPYFSGLFESGTGMSEGGGRASGEDIVIEGLSAGAFCTLLRFLYTHKLPEAENCGEGLEVGDNVVARLVLAHDSGLEALEEAGMCYFQAHAIVFQVRLLCLFLSHSFLCVIAEAPVGTYAQC